MPTARLRDIELDYALQGPHDGAPLVLIRGLGTQRIAWPEALLTRLAAGGLRVVTFDNRDAGLSTKLGQAGVPDLAAAVAHRAAGRPLSPPYSLADMADDVIGLLDALDVASAHVVGISMGGMIAQLAAGRSPERVRSLTSIMSTSGAAGLPAPSREAGATLLAPPPDPADREAVIESHLKVQRIIGSPGFFPGEAHLRREAAASYDRCHCPGGTARQLLAILAAESRVELLRRLELPCLVIHGADDPLVPVECGRDTASRIPACRLEIIPGMGHDVAPGLAPVLAELLLDHVRQTERAREAEGRTS